MDSLPRPGLRVLLVAPFLAQADATIANVATPAIGDDLGASKAELELVVGGYIVAFAVLLITGARLGQTHGYKRLFVLGMAGFGITSLAAGAAGDPALLIAARVLQGASAALMFPQSLTGIQLGTAGAERARALGVYAVALSVGAVSGQILGGVLVQADVAGLGWRAIFLINVPLVAVATVAALRHLPPDRAAGSPPRVDLAGVATLTTAVLLLIVPLTLGRSESWPAWTWVSLAASAPAFALFLAVERRVAAPLVVLEAIRPPEIRYPLLALGTAVSTYYAVLFVLAQHLQDGLGYSAIAAGLAFVPWVAAFGVAGQVVRRLRPETAARARTAGALLLAAVYAGVSALAFAGVDALAPTVAVLVFGGFGIGTLYSATLVHLTSAAAPEHAPDISGVSTTALQLGGALGVAAFGALYLSHADDTLHAFGLCTAAFSVTSLLAAALTHRGRSVARPPDYDAAPERFRGARETLARYGRAGDVHALVADRLIAEGALPVLDVGCGEGELARHLPGGAWVGLDASPTMLAAAPGPRHMGTADALPFPDGSFGAVALLYVLYHLDDPARALAEAHRVLAPGGRVVVAVPSRHDSPELAFALPRGALTCDAESAPDQLAAHFGAVEVDAWDLPMIDLPDHAAVAAYLAGKGAHDPDGAAARVATPLTVTKRGALVWASR